MKNLLASLTPVASFRILSASRLYSEAGSTRETEERSMDAFPEAINDCDDVFCDKYDRSEEEVQEEGAKKTTLSREPL